MLDLSVIKTRRKELDLTQTAVAEKVGISISHYSQIEKGERGLSIETLDALLKVLGLTIGNVWLDDREKQDAPTSVIIEKTVGNETTKYTLPATVETFRLLEMELHPVADPKFKIVAEKWETINEETKDSLLRIIGVTDEGKDPSSG